MVVSYTWLQEYFDEPLPPASELVELLSLHSFEIEGTEEVEGDTLIDIDVLPNRAHDCLSHRGIAREIGSVLGRDLYKDQLTDPFLELPESKEMRVEVDDDIPNTRTIGIFIKNVSVQESPDWLRNVLERLGQRSINNIVDATNYIMLQMGQPLHAFDAKVFSSGVLRIKRAEEGETLTLLGDISAELTTEDIVVSDGVKALDVAGIRGGLEAEITEETTDIVLSVSHFDPTMVRKTAQRLKLWTDAAKRFQNDPSPYLTEHGARECLELILDLAGGEVEGISRAGEKLPESHTVSLSVARVNKLLGLNLSQEVVEDILKRIGASFGGGGVLTVTIPHERIDLRIEEDLIEEIGRLYGYNKLPEEELPEKSAPSTHRLFIVSEHIRDVLTAAGFSEVYGYSLRNKGEIQLQNALNTEKNHLRTNLTDGLHEALDLNMKNLPLLGGDAVEIFEIGSVFMPEERIHLGIASTKKKVDFESLATKLGERLGVQVEGLVSDKVFEADITDVIEQVLLTALPSYTKHEGVFEVPSPYPYMLRDVAVWTPEGTTSEKIQELIASQAGNLLVRIDQFDEYSKEGRTSYAYHLVFQSKEKTSQIKWWRPSGPVVPIYIPGRFRTGSRPSRTVMSLAP